MANKTQFDRLTDRAVEATRELRRLESMNKLSAEQFMRDALDAAGCGHADLDQLSEKLDRMTADSVTAVRVFRRRIAQVVVGLGFPRAPRAAQAAKMARAYGRGETEVETLGLDATLSQIIALGIRDAVNARPERFGQVAVNWDDHQKQVATAKAAVDKFQRRLREEYAPRDVVIDYDRVTAAERDAGLAHIHFRRVPWVSPNNPAWPRDLIAALIDGPPAEEPAPKPTVPSVDPVRLAKAVAEALGEAA